MDFGVVFQCDPPARDLVTLAQRAERAGIPTFVARVPDYVTRSDWDLDLERLAVLVEPGVQDVDAAPAAALTHGNRVPTRAPRHSSPLLAPRQHRPQRTGPR